MQISGEYQIATDRERVWAALNDPDVLARSIPGCESLERISDTEFRARVTAAIGPVRAKFDSHLTLENLQPPQSYTLVGVSKAGAAGFGRGSANVTLLEQDDGTLLRYEADFKVGGKLAQVGSRLVLGATRKTADDFFGQFSRELDPGAVKVDLDEDLMSTSPALQSATIKAIGLALLLLLIWWFLLR